MTTRCPPLGGPWTPCHLGGSSPRGNRILPAHSEDLTDPRGPRVWHRLDDLLVIAMLDSDGLERCFQSWTASLSRRGGGRLIAADGTTLRHSFDHAGGQGAIHMFSAWCASNRMMLGHRGVENGLHGCLDIGYREDDWRVREG